MIEHTLAVGRVAAILEGSHMGHLAISGVLNDIRIGFKARNPQQSVVVHRLLVWGDSQPDVVWIERFRHRCRDLTLLPPVWDRERDALRWPIEIAAEGLKAIRTKGLCTRVAYPINYHFKFDVVQPTDRQAGQCEYDGLPRTYVCWRRCVNLGSTVVEDTFAEAFEMRFVRLIVTAEGSYWLDAAVREFTGYSSSVIACDAEIAVERPLSADETPDGRQGVSLLAFGFSKGALAKAIPNRAGQCLMTCPSTAVYDGLPDGESRIALGKHVRFFGDGYQKSKVIGDQRYWRIPVMDGEFVIQDTLGVGRGVAGGNIILQSTDRSSGLAAAQRGAEAVAAENGAIAPFPGGVARSGSKVGSRYKGLKASTSDPYCPSLRGRVESKLHPDANCAYEIVIDGVNEAAVGRAMSAAMKAAAGEQVVAITAGNYGGKLGKFHFHLHKLA